MWRLYFKTHLYGIEPGNQLGFFVEYNSIEKVKVEVASMKQMEQVEEWRKEKQILELKMAELKEALNTEGKSNLNRK